MHSNRAVTVVSLPLLLALAAAGCARQERVLARVGPEVITIEDFTNTAAAFGQNYALPPDSAKKRLLADLVRQRLLVQEAVKLGYDREPAYAAAVARAEIPYLTDALFRDQVGGDIQVSDAEVTAFYRQRGSETHARMIFVSDRRTAEKALADIRAGMDFAAASDRYSLPGMLPPGGDVGFLPPGSMLDLLDDDLRTRPPGWLSGPIPAQGRGYVVLQVLERRPREQPPLAAEAAKLREMLMQRKQRALAMRILDQLKREYQVQLVPGGSQFLFRKFTSLRAPAFLGSNPKPTMPEFRPDELTRPLVTWRGGEYVVRDALADLQAPAQQRPSLAMLPEMEAFLESQALQRVAVAEAKRRGLHLRPELAVRLRQRGDEWLINRLFERQVAARAVVESEAMRNLYLDQQQLFRVVDEVRLRFVETPDSTLAGWLARHPAGAGAAAFAARAQLRGARVQEARLRPAKLPPRWMEFAQLFSSLKPGEVAGPFQTATGWLVFQLADRRAHIPEFQQLDSFAQRSLFDEVRRQEHERLLGQLLDSLRTVDEKAGAYEVHPELLDRVPWPRPAAGPQA
jgi:peptidyl-prolyl cis-trans isomerase C